MNVDDGIRGRMARAPAIFAKGHVVAPAQIIYLKVPGNAVIAEVAFGAGNFTGFTTNRELRCSALVKISGSVIPICQSVEENCCR
jgi:hypothetical protein